MTVLPGPSAVETALVASGLAGEQYRFVGYIPRTENERAALWEELLAWPPSDGRINRRSGCRELSRASRRPIRPVCRGLPELTKLYEEVTCDTAAALSERFGWRRRER